MKARKIAILVVSFLIIAILNLTVFNGFEFAGYKYHGVLDKEEGIRLGIDLAGGSIITFQAVADEVTAEEMDVVETIIRKRLDSSGLTEAKIIVGQVDEKNITVEIPGETDADAAVALLGKTAQLSFQDYDGNVILSGATDIKNAKYEFSALTEYGPREAHVVLEFTEEGRPKFAAATKTASLRSAENGENVIKVVLDETVVSVAGVKEEINSDTATISGNFTAESATQLANQIKSGQLPFDLKVVEKTSVGPELGDKALSSSLLAGMIGIILIMLFMIFLYRLNGFVASIALCAYVGLYMLLVSVFKVNLSLPGIAGIILSIGMAVDANVIIFERMKEELRLGKTLRASVEAGFKRALSAIIDSNVTTLIASAVLYYFGVGAIKGFAVTLFIGVVLSMFTAIIVTKFLLKQMIGLQLTNPILYGVKKKEVEKNV